MRATKGERLRAERVSAAVDQLLVNPDAQPKYLDPQDVALLSTVRSLAQLPLAFGAVDPAFKDRVMRCVETQASGVSDQRKSGLRPVWAAVAVAVVIFVVISVTPWGQTALASFMAVFDLGRTQVRITPADVPSGISSTAQIQGATLQQDMTLESAKAEVPFAMLVPSYLPAGYRLERVTGYTYPDLPAWIPQPFSAELLYSANDGKEVSMRMYPIRLGAGEQASLISAMNLEAASIQGVQDVDVNGQPGVVLRLGPAGAKAIWHEVVWEQDDLILAISTADLSQIELLRMARSVR
ncbi:DUF4367 domain-containing protein [Chloroflexota bacterium]